VLDNYHVLEQQCWRIYLTENYTLLKANDGNQVETLMNGTSFDVSFVETPNAKIAQGAE
jgi:hypothetical protein